MNIENNKLIAEFMGCIIKDENGNLPTESSQHKLFVEEEWDKLNVCSPYSPNGVEYHTSWEWLIPVVEKIESLNVVCFEKNLQEEGDYQCLFTKGNDIFICHYADTSKEATYKAVVEFIKWYNETRNIN
jgi:hypothetical protein